MFGIIVLVICAAAYVINYYAPQMPSAVRLILNVVFVLVIVFLVLDLFGLYRLPFAIK
jgi:hypothetical protein